MSTIRDQILNSDDQKTELVDCPEWGVKVEVRGMTAGERGRFLAAASKNGEISQEHYFVDLAIQCSHDPDSGDKIFAVADRDTLGTKNGAAVQRIGEKAAFLSGLGGREEAKEALEETPT